jgi:hypothetical protein
MSLVILPAESSSSKAGETGERNDNFGLMTYLCSYFEGVLTCRKILRHEADGSSPPPKEGVLRILVALKNPLPSAGLKRLNLWSNSKHR